MPKRIVICADGTWNRPEKDPQKEWPTNVLRMARAIRLVADDGAVQQVFYDWGVGSYHDAMYAGITGQGLQKNIMDAYRYIVQNYTPGDELFFFGVSRGAYTVRSLCGMINNVGLLKRADANLIQMAFDHYKRGWPDYAPEGKASIAFRKKHAHGNSRGVRFVGVWDTVGAMGIPLSFLGMFENKDEFYDTKLGPNVAVARHALALNERRVDFQPTLWQPRAEVDLQQVWFVGCHSDVGGSHGPDEPAGGVLSAIPLKWMVKQASQFGLAVESHVAKGVKADPMASIHESRRTFYRLRERYSRPIEPLVKYKTEEILVPTQIHKSVKARWDADSDYRPRALVKHLESQKDSKGGGWNLVS